MAANVPIIFNEALNVRTVRDCFLLPNEGAGHGWNIYAVQSWVVFVLVRSIHRQDDNAQWMTTISALALNLQSKWWNNIIFQPNVLDGRYKWRAEMNSMRYRSSFSFAPVHICPRTATEWFLPICIFYKAHLLTLSFWNNQHDTMISINSWQHWESQRPLSNMVSPQCHPTTGLYV